MKYKCIIFDCDGVLVDSEAISAKIFMQMLAEPGFETGFELIFRANNRYVDERKPDIF